MNNRWIYASLEREIAKPFVHILFGARQTGKTTLLRALLPHLALDINLADPMERTRQLADPGLLRRECEALPHSGTPQTVFIDEAQRVPHVFDTVQVLYDRDHTRWRFVLCGSSARKLRKAGTNLLPGRSLMHTLYPLVMAERPPLQPASSRILPLAERAMPDPFPAADIMERLAYGELPGISLLPVEDRGRILQSYAIAHLEEEVRKEALVENWGAFINFLRLAGAESGRMINYANISQQVGLSLPTVKSHYQLLQDMYLGFVLPAFGRSPRRNLLSTPRFFFVDVGLCHAARGQVPHSDLVEVDPGRFFEQWVVTELWKRTQYLQNCSLSYYATKDGAEIDAILEYPDRLVPIEVKWTQNPQPKDARHLRRFIADHPLATEGFIVCRAPRPQKLSKEITAIPWSAI